jgi:hypothetical protein
LVYSIKVDESAHVHPQATEEAPTATSAVAPTTLGEDVYIDPQAVGEGSSNIMPSIVTVSEQDPHNAPPMDGMEVPYEYRIFSPAMYLTKSDKPPPMETLQNKPASLRGEAVSTASTAGHDDSPEQSNSLPPLADDRQATVLRSRVKHEENNDKGVEVTKKIRNAGTGTAAKASRGGSRDGPYADRRVPSHRPAARRRAVTQTSSASGTRRFASTAHNRHDVQYPTMASSSNGLTSGICHGTSRRIAVAKPAWVSNAYSHPVSSCPRFR